MIDITKPLYTESGLTVVGVAPNPNEDQVREGYELIGYVEGSTVYNSEIFTANGCYYNTGERHACDLTNTPPADYTPPASQPDELTALRERIAELEHQLRQANKANAEAWRVAVNYQRAAAKGAVR